MELLNELREEGVRARVVPTPSSIIDGCGLSLVIKGDDEFKKANKYNDKFIACQIIKNSEKQNTYLRLQN